MSRSSCSTEVGRHSLQDADAPAVAQELSKLRDALRSSQQHVHSLMGCADDLTMSQVPNVPVHTCTPLPPFLCPSVAPAARHPGPS